MKTNTNQTRKHVFAALLTGAVLMAGPASLCSENISAYINMEQRICEPVSDNIAIKTVEEANALFAQLEEEEAMRAAAPVQKGWFGSVIDEIARWFGLSE